MKFLGVFVFGFIATVVMLACAALIILGAGAVAVIAGQWAESRGWGDGGFVFVITFLTLIFGLIGGAIFVYEERGDKQ